MKPIEAVARAICAIEEEGDETYWENYFDCATKSIAALADNISDEAVKAFREVEEQYAARVEAITRDGGSVAIDPDAMLRDKLAAAIRAMGKE